jgi:hypothetical protein
VGVYGEERGEGVGFIWGPTGSMPCRTVLELLACVHCHHRAEGELLGLPPAFATIAAGGCCCCVCKLVCTPIPAHLPSCPCVLQDPQGSYLAAPMRLGQELETLQERASGELGEAGRRSSRGAP